MKKHAVRCVNDELNLQVINPARLGQKVSGLSDRFSTHITTKNHLVLKCSISSSLLYPNTDFTAAGSDYRAKKNLELEANPTERDCHRSASVHHPRRNQIFEICSSSLWLHHSRRPPPREEKRLPFPLMAYEILKKLHQHTHRGSTLTAWICAFFMQLSL